MVCCSEAGSVVQHKIEATTRWVCVRTPVECVGDDLEQNQPVRDQHHNLTHTLSTVCVKHTQFHDTTCQKCVKIV